MIGETLSLLRWWPWFELEAVGETSLMPDPASESGEHLENPARRDLDKVGFNLVGTAARPAYGTWGCCPIEISEAVNKNDLVA